jgi:hypothetical protein
MGDLHRLKKLVDSLSNLGLGAATDLEPECDVLADREMAKGRIVLKAEAHSPLTGRHPG